MVADLEKLCDNHFGRRVLLYLLSPRNPQHFSSQFTSILSPGDTNSHRYIVCVHGHVGASALLCLSHGLRVSLVVGVNGDAVGVLLAH